MELEEYFNTSLRTNLGHTKTKPKRFAGSFRTCKAARQSANWNFRSMSFTLVRVVRYVDDSSRAT